MDNEIAKPNGFKKTLPNLFLLGGSKCASSTFSGWLGQHPQILLSTPKESGFFHTDEYQNGMDYYSEKFFRGYNQELYALEASPINLVVQYVADRIAESCGTQHNKFIIIVREPMVRAYSEYLMYKGWRPGRVHETFHEELKFNMERFSYERYKYEYEVMGAIEKRGGLYYHGFIESSLFYHNISRFIEKFGRNNVHIDTFDNLIENPEELYIRALEFLRLPYYHPVYVTRNMSNRKKEENLHTIIDSPLLSTKSYLRSIAIDIFLKDVEKLSELIDEDLVKKWEYDKL